MTHLLVLVIYLAFISLGLPDGLLGSGWPSMYTQLGADVSWAGILSLITAAGTIISSLMSDRLTYRLGTGRVTMFSVALTAAALLGFSFSDSFLELCLWSIPYGFGAGSVDASLNNYVALHYSSRHMSWLHCMWGVGASTGPYIMGAVLSGGGLWTGGYRAVGLIQVLLTAILLFSLPLWKARPGATGDDSRGAKPLPLSQVFRIPGAWAVLITFLCYCSLEVIAGLWASSYLVLHRGIDPETAAFFGSMFYMGMTVGRAINGFLTTRFSDTDLIRMGCVLILAGAVAMLLPLGDAVALVGLLLVGLGCAPIYPCVIHSTPSHFGEENSQALIGMQMAFAYTGSCMMPTLYGLLSDWVSPGLLPVCLLFILVCMVCMHETMLRKVKKT